MLRRRVEMSRRMRRLLAVGPAVLLLAVGVASAAAPTGPRLAAIKMTWKPMRHTLVSVDRNGHDLMRVAGGQEDGPVDSIVIAPLSWRPDGSEVAFTGLGAFWLARADGGGAREVNAARAELPVFAPDGVTIAFTRFPRYDEAAIWTIDLTTGEQRQLTPSRRGLHYIASSYSPDGTTLLATRFDENRRGDAEPVALDLASGRVRRLIADGIEPVYSPDASQIALFRRVGKRQLDDLFILDLTDGRLRRLTRTPHKNELFASWDPSGERIAFARFRGEHYGWANSIVQINADGTCETEIVAQRRTVFYGPAWQPGPGREAGRIAC
jgi:Tol biopolymer transport system component